MASGSGRGAQVRIKEEQQAVARGAGGGGLLANILAKQRLERRGEGSDGLSADGATWTGTDALDYVLTPGGRLDGYVDPAPSGPGAMRGALALSVGFAGTAEAASSAPGAMRGVLRVSTALSGTAHGAAALAGDVPVRVSLAGLAGGTGAMRGEIATRFTTAGTLAGPGPMQGAMAVRVQFGSGLFGRLDVATALSGTLRGTGALQGSTGATVALAGTARGLARASGSLAATVALSGTLTGIGGTVVTPNTVHARGGSPVGVRGGGTLAIRPVEAAAVLSRDGSRVVTRDGPPLAARLPAADGGVTDRTGAAVGVRGGGRLAPRRVPDVVEPPPQPEPEPQPEPVVFPTGPHLRIVPNNAGAVVLHQDGRTAKLRLVRPLYAATSYCDLAPWNTTAWPENFYWSDRHDRFREEGGSFHLLRELTSEDDGTYQTTIFRNMSDGTFLQLEVEITVAADATTPNPQPTPRPPPHLRPFLERFDFGRGTGALIRRHAWERIETTPGGTVLLKEGIRHDQADGSYWVDGCTLMTETSSGGINSPDFGFPNGRFEFRARFLGPGLGDGPGPAIILWPADDIWPGTEIDIGELFADGTLYYANHWRGANGQDEKYIWPVSSSHVPGLGPGFDRAAWNVHAVDLFTNRLVYWCNGVMVAEVTDHPAPDHVNGGVNHTVGLQNGSTQTRLECDWIRFTPEALIPAGPYVPFVQP